MKEKERMSHILYGLLAACLALSLYGCAGQVASHEEAVTSVREGAAERVPDSFAAAAEGGTVDDGWLRSFQDPTLDSLVSEALANNPGLKIAQAQVDRANGLTRQAEAGLKPTVGLAAGYQDRQTQGYENDVATAGLAVSWEADVWGRIRTGIAGEKEAAAATAADFQFARQSLAAATANAWFVATTSKLQHRLAEEVVQLQEKNLEIAEARTRIGQGTQRDVHLARANKAAAQEASRQALSAYEDSLRSLELLLGRYPSADLEAAETLVAVPPPVPAGIPSAILERRPDLIAAENQVAAAFYKQKEAELLHLPRFQFSLGLGINSLTDAVAGLAAGVVAPLYTGGAIEGQVDTATAEQKGAIAAYAQSGLQAFKEVETALAAEEHLLKREEYLKIEVAENGAAYEQTRQHYEIGKISLLDVLLVQGTWIEARIAKLDIASRRLINRVQLHLTLGGSFEEAAAADAQ